MKSSKKTILVMAVTLLLAAVLFVGAGAAMPGTGTADAPFIPTSQEELETAMAKTMQPTTYITLGDDIGNMKGITVATGKNFNLDLNNKTLTFTRDPVGPSDTKNQCFQFLEGSTIVIKNGNIVVDPAAGETFRFVIQNYANLTLTDVNIDGSKLNSTTNQCAVSTNNGVVFINGLTSITAPNGGVALDVYNRAGGPGASYPYGTQVHIALTATDDTTGTFRGAITFGSSSGTDSDIKFTSSLEISRGVFIGDIFTYKEGTPGVVDVPKDKLKITGGSFTVSNRAAKALIEKYADAGAATITIGQQTTLTLEIGEMYVLDIPSGLNFVKDTEENYVASYTAGVTDIAIGGGSKVIVTVSSGNEWILTPDDIPYTATWDGIDMQSDEFKFEAASNEPDHKKLAEMVFTIDKKDAKPGINTDTLTFYSTIENAA